MWHQANYISVVYLGDMLAGIIICVLVLAGLAFGVPWLMGGRETVDEVDGDPSERFSDSVRVLHRDVIDYQEAADAAPISTPLMRKAERGEVKLLARQAARRRRRAILGLTFLLLTTTGVALFDLVPLWTIAIPAGLIVMYLVFARINSALMYRALDQRVKKADEGYDEEETSAISLAQPEDQLRSRSTWLRQRTRGCCGTRSQSPPRITYRSLWCRVRSAQSTCPRRLRMVRR